MAARLAVAAAVVTAAAVGCGEKDEPAGAGGAEAGRTTSVPDTTTTTVTQPQRNRPDGPSGPSRRDGSQETLSPEELVAETVATVLGGPHPPAACYELVTERYVRDAYGDRQGCEAAVSSRKPFDVEVTVVGIDSTAARARARPLGGPNEGEAIQVELVRDGTGWRVDEARSNVPVGP